MQMYLVRVSAFIVMKMHRVLQLLLQIFLNQSFFVNYRLPYIYMQIQIYELFRKIIQKCVRK